MNGTAVVTVDDVRSALGCSRTQARGLFSDQGGPLRLIPHLGRRVLAPRGDLESLLDPPSRDQAVPVLTANAEECDPLA
jgi:hypothetical protein